MNNDLKKFRKIFDRDNVKEHKNKLEYRVKNLESSMTDARDIITKNNLQLDVYTDGMLSSYRAFEVKINNQ